MPCEKLTYTLRIPADLPQDIPSLTIGAFPDGFVPASPSVIGNASALVFTPAQKPVIGSALSDRFIWPISCLLTEAQSLQLGALYQWQQRRYKGGLDGRLEWIDRFEPTEPAPEDELVRNITDAQTTAYDMVYGFMVVDCLISRPSRVLSGNRGGVSTRVCDFSVEEIR